MKNSLRPFFVGVLLFLFIAAESLKFPEFI